jgi:hypothetical protein
MSLMDVHSADIGYDMPFPAPTYSSIRSCIGEFMVYLGMSGPLRAHPSFWNLARSDKSSDLVAS